MQVLCSRLTAIWRYINFVLLLVLLLLVVVVVLHSRLHFSQVSTFPRRLRTTWRNSRRKTSAQVGSRLRVIHALVENYLANLNANCTPPENATATSSYQITVQNKQRLGDLFEDMYTQPDKEEEPERAAKKCKVSFSTPALQEIKEFHDSRVPVRDPTGFWKLSRLARLKTCAKILFSVPVSSAGIERLFS